ncbi:MAG TPA: dTDP-4-dehydrorhamnose 3,5-epimerase [Flavobacterium sp.]|jgi:dTDP-4-dehydrorhamnose 3,5-epimerase
MKFTPTSIAGCFILEPKALIDDRGYFMESFNENLFFENTGLKVHFVQDNQSFSSKGVLRGLHYQTDEHAQAKLVRVISGEVLDVAVDIRPESPTFGKHVAVHLSAENRQQLYIPRGMAHGFLVLSDTATFFYKCDNFYNRESEGGIYFNDPELAINWQLPTEELILSEKDKNLPPLKTSKKVW